MNTTVQTAVGRKSLHTGRRPKDISRLIVGSWLLPSPNACRSRRRSFPTGSARLRKLLKKASMPRSSPRLGPEAPERTGVLKRDVAVQEGPHRNSSGGVVRMIVTRHSRLRSTGSRHTRPGWIVPKSESFASKSFRHSDITPVFKTTFEVFTRVGPDNSLERLTERSVGLVTDRPSNVYELLVTLFE